MARQASLKINGTIFSGGLLKLDRKKIYGWSKIDIFDEEDKPCKLASIYDGRYVLPSGSTSLLCFNKNGDYISKSSLVGVDNNGVKVEKVDLFLMNLQYYPSQTLMITYLLMSNQFIN